MACAPDSRENERVGSWTKDLEYSGGKEEEEEEGRKHNLLFKHRKPHRVNRSRGNTLHVVNGIKKRRERWYERCVHTLHTRERERGGGGREGGREGRREGGREGGRETKIEIMIAVIVLGNKTNIAQYKVAIERSYNHKT